jgi:hypothetical protein
MAKSTALGMKLSVKTGTPSTLVEVKGITTLNTPSVTKPEIDVTSLDSVGAEFLPGLPDAGSIDFDGLWNPADAGQVALRDMAVDDAAAVIACEIEVSDNVTTKHTYAFNAYVASFTVTGAVSAAKTFSASLRVTGGVTVTVAALP